MLWDARKFRFNAPMLLLGFALLFVSCKEDISGPLKKIPAPGREYYPLNLGDTWEYTNGGDYRETYEITSVQATDDGNIATVTVQKDGVVSHQEIMRWIGDRLYLNIADNGDDVEPLVLLSLPLALHKEWTKGDYSSGRTLDVTRTRVISMDSTFDVDAGTYDSVVLRDIHTHQVEDHEPSMDTTYYAYAKNVGIIYRGFYDDALQLLSFTPGDTTTVE